jgi:hypothetical protein
MNKELEVHTSKGSCLLPVSPQVLSHDNLGTMALIVTPGGESSLLEDEMFMG